MTDFVPFMAAFESLCHFTRNSSHSCQQIGLPVHVPSNCAIVLAMLLARLDPFAFALTEEYIAQACPDGRCLFLINCEGSLNCKHRHSTRAGRTVLVLPLGRICQSDCQIVLTIFRKQRSDVCR